MRMTFSFVCLALTVGCQLSLHPKAELVLRRGKIITLSSDRPVAEAIAINGDRITAVGSAAEINPYIGPETRVIDLEGAVAVPGFIESHAHFLSLGFSKTRLDLVGTKSPRAIVRLVAQAVEGAAEGAWIQGRGWD
ncbi:MAG: amidohydrolase family protein, partial [Acidobacteriota bacterium]